MKRNKILHITPHLGGGVGRVLLNYFKETKNNESLLHEIACLDDANRQAIETAEDVGLLLTDRLAGESRRLMTMVSRADIVIIHWWNHPLLFEFLVRTSLPPCRLVLWSHISGFHPPYVFTEKIFRYPDLFVFTTPISYETEEAKNCPDEIKMRVIWSTGGVEHVRSIQHTANDEFTVGYIGTVDYAKLHPEFLALCNAIDIHKIRFIVCGGPSEKCIQNEAERFGLNKKMIFTGLVSDIRGYLSMFDIFGYPLAPYHYGTCDQSLAESMAAGVVPVVFANRMEKSMVRNGVTGIVAKDKKDYVDAVRALWSDSRLRAFLSNNAKEYALNTFTLEKMVKEWDMIFDEALSFPKKRRKWELYTPVEKISAADIFLESLGEQGKPFWDYCHAGNEKEKEHALEKIVELGNVPLWQAETRGTVHHYYRFFSNDPVLEILSRSMKGHADLK